MINNPNKYKINLLFIIKLALFFVYFFLCASQLLSFELWPQVTRIWEIENGIAHGGKPYQRELLSAITTDGGYKYAHMLRYFLVVPIFTASSLLGIEYNYLFSLLFPFFILYSSLIVSQSVLYLLQDSLFKKNDLIFSLFFLVLCFVSFFMNGRMVFAIMASSILIFITLSWEKISLPTMAFNAFLGFFLSSVSSGVFLVYFSSLLGIFFYKVLLNKSTIKRHVFSFSVLMTMIFSPFLLDSLLKNIDYFGGGLHGIIGMLNHGLGSLFFNDSYFYRVSFLIIVVAVNCIGLYLYLTVKELRPLVIVTFIAFLGSMFGYSVLTMAILPIMVFFYFFINNYSVNYLK
ncbi:hypothetical protein [Candidatus Sororendozoicomonas aggregata]|uniref:hypothetical protein n=1 Tax=Candidatus Sororendozoicomonas aggregata TaxID=3073239 RepID=UPI002ED57AB9